MKYLIALVLCYLTACSTHPVSKNTEVSNNTRVSEAKQPIEPVLEEPSRHQKIYFFQHKVLPKWLYESDDAFYFDLSNGYFSGIYRAAEEYIDSEFSEALEIRYLRDNNAVLFVFEKPSSAPNCFFAVIKKEDKGYRFITYESTMPLNDDVVGIVGGWNAKGGHINNGARAYRTSEEFLQDVLKDIRR